MRKNLWETQADQLYKLMKKWKERTGTIKRARFFHYTSISKLFSMLEGDELWLSSPKFSNDYTEEKLFGEEYMAKHNFDWDNYIICFGEGHNDITLPKGEIPSTSDLLSMWRGYCPDGGASIEFYFDQGDNVFSVLNRDYDTSKDFTLYHQNPLPVIYTDVTEINNTAHELSVYLDGIVKSSGKDSGIDINDVIPYIKHDMFSEEREARIVLSNRDNQLASCVRFRKLDDGSYVPYIVAKFGDLDESKGRCVFNAPDKSILQYIKEEVRPNKYKPIIIPQGNNQASVYNDVEKIVKEHNETARANTWSIICKGHLPVLRITVSPNRDKEKIVEQLKIFCRSKYWLRNVEIKCSEIPYSPFLR